LLGQRDYDGGGESWLKALETPPSSSYGAAVLFDAYLFQSDLFFQTRLLLPRKREMEFVLVPAPMKGIAQLAERRPEEAWETFKIRWLQPEVSAETYSNNLKVEITAEELKLHIDTACAMCEAGMGRVLFDLGLRNEAARVFADLIGKLDGNLKYAAQVLSQA